jgi:hypothetical protein
VISTLLSCYANCISYGNTYKQTIKDMQEEFEDIKGVIRRRRTDNTMAKRQTTIYKIYT